MAKVETKTEWEVTDEDGAVATVRVDRASDSGPTLKIEQGGEHMVWLAAEALPDFIKVLTAAQVDFAGHTV